MRDTTTCVEKSYNSLLDVADAHRKLESLGGDDALAPLLSVIFEAGLEAFIGIRLLHKHNDISADEIMHERMVVDDEGFSLVTAAMPRADVVDVACNSWQLSDTGYIPVEYSDSNLLCAGFDVKKYASVLGDLARLIRSGGVADILGPCLNYSEAVGLHAPSADSAFLEKTDAVVRSNVVRYVLRDDVAFTNSAKTKWQAQRVVDASGKVTWMTACNCFCSVLPSGGHQGTTTHRYTKDKEEEECLVGQFA
jgi:hypothetical protein